MVDASSAHGAAAASRAAVDEFRVGSRLARQLLIHHGRVVDEGGHDHRGLLHVVGLDPIEDVLVGVVSPRVVLDLVLDELEAGQADAVERLVVGAAGVGDRQGGGAHLAERLEPLAEDRPDGLVALHVDAADLAGAVIEVEIGRELGELGLGRRFGRILGAAVAPLPLPLPWMRPRQWRAGAGRTCC